jgi:hypothetical protein
LLCTIKASFGIILTPPYFGYRVLRNFQRFSVFRLSSSRTSSCRPLKLASLRFLEHRLSYIFGKKQKKQISNNAEGGVVTHSLIIIIINHSPLQTSPVLWERARSLVFLLSMIVVAHLPIISATVAVPPFSSSFSLFRNPSLSLTTYNDRKRPKIPRQFLLAVPYLFYHVFPNFFLDYRLP